MTRGFILGNVSPAAFRDQAHRDGYTIVAVTGHRPDKLGGYFQPPMKTPPLRAWVREQLCEEMEWRRKMGPLLVLSGMAQGVDQDWAMVAVNLRVPFVAVVPFEGQSAPWPIAAREHHAALLGRARETVLVHDTYTDTALMDRNWWMVQACDEIVAVWDGSKGGTGHCVSAARGLKRPVKIIDPRERP